MQVKALNHGPNEARWDEFVLSCPEATFFHRSGWRRVIEEVQGHSCHYLYAERDGVIEGVFPIGHVRSRLFGNALISMPFGVYGGIAASSEEARTALDTAGSALLRKVGAEYLEVRGLRPAHTDWPTKDLYVTFRKEIDPDSEKNLLAIPRKQRAMVRKGEKAGLVGVIDSTVDRFYSAYADSVRHLGTPVNSKRYYAALLDVFGDDAQVLTITHNNNVVASVLSFYFRDEVLPYYGGGTRLARDVAGNDFMYWELMQRANARGVRIFDFGRSKQGTGSYSFKKNWGFEAQPLYYQYQLHTAQAMPDLNPLNPKYRLFIRAWQALPVGLTKWIGPWLARNLA